MCLFQAEKQKTSFVLIILSHVEIEARPDMVSDKKLDKLESFLGRLNSKGMYFQTNMKLYNCTFYSVH